MPLKLYNTYSRKKEIFEPLRKSRVTMYNCGPTVYDYVHIGNLSSYLMADLVRRYLEHKKYKVKQIMNITDVGHLVSDGDFGEDKMMKGAEREKKSPQEIAQFYTQAFFKDIKNLNIKKADQYPKATDHIQEMIEIIKELLNKGFAYKIKGNIYFDISKFKNYGKLSGNTTEKLKELKKGARSEIVKDKNKKNPFDFALWLKAPENHLMKWDSPWGIGYPGWHIECSAMSIKYLGKSIDIHTGGEDNIFPHHENEITQSEALNNEQFVKYWMHKRYLLVDGKKMSKSKDNFYKLEDLKKMGFDPIDFRFLVIQSHYRSQINFSNNALKQAHESLNRIKDFLSRLKLIDDGKNNKDIKKIIQDTKENFEKHMNNDLDTPQALASLFEFINIMNKFIDHNNINKDNAQSISNFILVLDKILGFNLKDSISGKRLHGKIHDLIMERELARKNKNWTKADEIRDELLKLGIEIKDTNKGTIWKQV